MKHATAILALVMLAGCKPDAPEWRIDAEAVLTPDQPKPNLRAMSADQIDRFISVFTDPDTGCQYLMAWGSTPGGITPRLNPDGTQVCTRREAP